MDKENQQHVLLHLKDMFQNIPLELIKSVCLNCNWRVDECIDTLITEYSKQPTQYQSGAIAKDINTTKQTKATTNNNCAILHKDELKIIEKIKAGYKILILMRGAPGSGKSTLAKLLLSESISIKYRWNDFVLSSDDYFYDSKGNYRYDIRRLQDAHAFNQKRVDEKAGRGLSPIIIDNTNMELWEMLPYVKTAVRNAYLVEILEPKTSWRLSAGKLAVRNTHQVPKDKIERMLFKYQYGTANDLINMLKDTKYNVPLPQKRWFPPIEENIQSEELLCTDQIIESATIPINAETPFKNTLQHSQNICDNVESIPKEKSLINLMADSVAWEPYEKEATNFWNLPTKNLNKSDSSSCDKTLLDLLKEGVSDQIQAEAKSEERSIFKRHSRNCRNENESFASLCQIYPNKDDNSLWDLFIKCNGDIDWVVDILLRESELSYDNESDTLPRSSNEASFVCDCDKMATSNPTPKLQDCPIVISGLKPQPQRIRSRVRTNQRSTNLENQEVKQTIENSFVIGDEHYSNHIRKVRDIRNCGLDGPFLKFSNDAITQTDDPTADELAEEDDFTNELLELTLDDTLITQLSCHFRDETEAFEQLSETPYKNVFIPRTLAKELYLLWLESAYNHVEEQRQQIVKEDEDFARLLKNPKYSDYQQSPSNIRELLDMELAWNLYKGENLENKLNVDTVNTKNPTDLAQHLTQMKLCETFPDIPRETLLDVLAAHNNHFTETIDLLRSTLDEKNANTLSHLTKEELMHRVEQENQKLNKTQFEINPDFQNANTERVIKSDEAKHMALRDFEEMRNYAAHHCQLKTECYQKAKDAIQNGNGSVAIYYSQIANFHRNKIDLYNQRAASSIMDVQKCQNNPDLLDLHYLHQLEAVGCLDLFLDRHITDLRRGTRTYKSVFIITGRGLHSVGGVSVIKNKVKYRLKERNLRWKEVNPGLLKVKLFSASRHSKNI